MKKTLSERLLAPVNWLMGGRNRITDVAYGAGPQMRYDEYPSSDLAAPLVIFWYGGSWKTGNKNIYRFMGHTLQQMGTHAFVVDYPKYPQQTFPGFIEDAAAVLAHIRARFPNRKIVLMGHSAGANTALLTAMTTQAPVDGVVSIAGVCTLTPQYWYPVFGDALAKNLHDPRHYAQTSPQETSYLLIHGLLDRIVPSSDAVTLNKALQGAGRRSQLLLLKCAEHALILPLIAFGPLVRTRHRIKQFIFADTPSNH